MNVHWVLITAQTTIVSWYKYVWQVQYYPKTSGEHIPAKGAQPVRDGLVTLTVNFCLHEHNTFSKLLWDTFLINVAGLI